MRTLGIVGGISYHSTAVYYRSINQLVNETLGGNISAKIILYSVNYAEFKAMQTRNDWIGIEHMLSDIAIKLENAGADCILISCNAAHLVVDSIVKKLKIPFIHIADTAANVIEKQEIKKVALLGTKITMENAFFTDRLKSRGIEILLPDADERDFLNETILTELAKAKFALTTKKEYLNIIQKLAGRGAEAVIFACTEIGLLLNQADTNVKIFDTTEMHIAAAVAFAASEN